MTFLIYLNDDVSGGETKFYLPNLSQDESRIDADGKRFFPIDIVSVTPKKGSVICFHHGNHNLSPIHEGGAVANGAKYVVRTDVLYKRNE